jgi:DNA-binding CsgD family transcriptional regulator
METIQVGDAARMMDALVDLTSVSIRDPGRTVETAVHEMHRVIGCDAVIVHLGGSAPWWTSSDDPRIFEPRRRDPEGWLACMPDHPTVAHRSRTGDYVTPLTFSDVVSTLAFRRTRMFDEFWKPSDTSYKLSIAMPVGSDRMIDIGFTRSLHDFDGRERTILSLMRPRLARILRDALLLDALSQHGLTTRERDILAQVAAGRSNAQIAAELFLSPGTVRKHLEHVYAKLGIHSRTEAASLVRRAALAPLNREPDPEADAAASYGTERRAAQTG